NNTDDEICYLFFFSSRRRHTRSKRDWSSDVCSSDLRGTWSATACAPWSGASSGAGSWRPAPRAWRRWRKNTPPSRRTRVGTRARSEEHTSELQSRFDLVCRLLLDKKNNDRYEPQLTD